MRETDCAQSSNIYNVSPGRRAGFHDVVDPDAESPNAVGNGLRSLPRIASSKVVHNLKEIQSARNHEKGKYRHVSHADFHHKSSDARTAGIR